MGNYNDVLLEQLADQGDGFYAYVNDLAEARRLFTEDLTGTLQTVALDAKVQVEFDPAVVDAYRLVGYENRAIADEDFRDPRVDAGAIGAGHAVTALYALRPARRLLAATTCSARSGCAGPSPERRASRQLARDDHDRRPRHAVPGSRARRSSSMPSSRRPRRSCAATDGPRDLGPARHRRCRSARPATSRRPTRSTTSSISSNGWRTCATSADPDRSGRLALVRVGRDRRARSVARAVPCRARPATASTLASRAGPRPCRWSSAPVNSTMNARISECSVQAACGMSAGQTAASPAAIRVRSSPTPTQPPPSTTMNR